MIEEIMNDILSDPDVENLDIRMDGGYWFVTAYVNYGLDHHLEEFPTSSFHLRGALESVRGMVRRGLTK